MNLIEAKQELREHGYKLIKERHHHIEVGSHTAVATSEFDELTDYEREHLARLIDKAFKADSRTGHKGHVTRKHIIQRLEEIKDKLTDPRGIAKIDGWIEKLENVYDQSTTATRASDLPDDHITGLHDIDEPDVDMLSDTFA